MKIQLKKLILTNFKGIKNLSIDLNHVTSIFGENAAGKTSVFDAFTWLFFGKDSTDRKDFELKPLDENGNPLQKVDVEVSAVIEVDGKAIEIKKILREKWRKKHGELIPEFSGNENLFYWNDVPLQLKQFQDKISELINENLFKLITNPLYFNSLKWQDRRSVLLQLAGDITNSELILLNPDFKNLISLLGDKSLEEYKREVSAKKKKLKDELEGIPTRIDEINRQMPQAADFDALRTSIAEKQEAINNIDEALQNATKMMESVYTQKRNQQTKLHELKNKSGNLYNDIRSKFSDASQHRKNNITDLERQLSGINQSLTNSKHNIDFLNKEIINLENDKAIVSDEWVKTDAEKLEFNDNKLNCPSCKRPLDPEQVNNNKNELTENFNTDKANRLQRILAKGTGLAGKITEKKNELRKISDQYSSLQKELQQLQVQIDNAKDEHQSILNNAESEFNKELSTNKEYLSIINEIDGLQLLIEIPINEADDSQLKEQKANLNIELDALKRQLTNEDRIIQSKNRIDELQHEEKQLAQQLADLEGSEYLAEQFTKAKMDTLVNRINGRFKHVTFKMFDTQINGGEIECCDTLVNGVPFPDANNAAKINAGLDIINTLCEHYNVYAPIFIDNRESVNELIECNSQVVNLIVSHDKKLRVA